VAILDSYAAPTYISDASLSPYDAPIRLLCTSEQSSWPTEAIAFTPPNLIQSLPAALMTVLEIARIRGAAVLLPSLHVAMPSKPEPTPLDDFAGSTWSQEAMTVANNHLSLLLGMTQLAWKAPPSTSASLHSRRSGRPARGDVVGEGSMYI